MGPWLSETETERKKWSRWQFILLCLAFILSLLLLFIWVYSVDPYEECKLYTIGEAIILEVSVNNEHKTFFYCFVKGMCDSQCISLTAGNANVCIQVLVEIPSSIRSLQKVSNIFFHTWSHLKVRLCLKKNKKKLMCVIEKICRTYFLWSRDFTSVQKLARAEEKMKTAESLPHGRVWFGQTLHNNMTMTQRPRWKIYWMQLVPHLPVGLNITAPSRRTWLKCSSTFFA